MTRYNAVVRTFKPKVPGLRPGRPTTSEAFLRGEARSPVDGGDRPDWVPWRSSMWSASVTLIGPVAGDLARRECY